MQFGRWLLFSCVCLVLANDEKVLAPLQWQGGVTKMDGAGRTCPNGVSTRIQFYKNEIFTCMPRLKPGSEVTLARTFVPDTPGTKPVLEPYPPNKPQTEGDCSCLQSVVDIYLDDANLLWALDVGSIKMGAPGQPPISRCTPKIFGINVENGQVDHVIQLSPLLQPGTRFQFIVADYSLEGQCFLYISDAGTKSIIVYDVMNNKSHRVVLPENILPSPYGVRDVLYLALIKKDSGNLLYFTYRSSDNMFCIETKFLQKDASSAKSYDVGKKPGQIIPLGTDNGSCMYFRYVDKADVFKWCTEDPFAEANFHLVHSGGQLTPTHACPDFERGLMKVCESNLPTYLNPKVKQNDSLNSISVMQVVD